MEKNIIEFIRKKDYVFVKELGQGACGKTVLLRDEIIEENFVCKKYSPVFDENKEILFRNFVQEIKLLHLVYHLNVVRVFSHFLYPSKHAGYILMEFIEGYDIEEYLREHPENINNIFLQTIEGFKHLETNNILHRDIRPQNILVRNDGTVKIIDFGFGKQIIFESDFDKSISLNWWCAPPEEFNEHTYDFKTEIYFVGKLFEKIIKEYGIEHFKFSDTLNQMCQHVPKNRIKSFFDVNKELQKNKFVDIDFSVEELNHYRNFSDNLYQLVSKIEGGTKYFDDIDKLQNRLDALYKNCMLEESLPDNTTLIQCFINGAYYYKRNFDFRVYVLKYFIDLLRSCSIEKKNIIIGNLHTKLDSVPRYYQTTNDGDIPF